eukprot:4808858-Pleurochrysis_carterae.AAC.3
MVTMSVAACDKDNVGGTISNRGRRERVAVEVMPTQPSQRRLQTCSSLQHPLVHLCRIGRALVRVRVPAKRKIWAMDRGGGRLRSEPLLLPEQLVCRLAAVLDQPLLDLVVRRVEDGRVALQPEPRDDGHERAVGTAPAVVVVRLGQLAVARPL